MKLVLITYNEAIDEEVMGLLNGAGAEGYTKFTAVLGKGRAGGPHLLSHVWPKGNNALVVTAQDDVARKVLDAVRGLRRTAGREGVKAFLLPVEDVS